MVILIWRGWVDLQTLGIQFNKFKKLWMMLTLLIKCVCGQRHVMGGHLESWDISVQTGSKCLRPGLCRVTTRPFQLDKSGNWLEFIWGPGKRLSFDIQQLLCLNLGLLTCAHVNKVFVTEQVGTEVTLLQTAHLSTWHHVKLSWKVKAK